MVLASKVAEFAKKMGVSPVSLLEPGGGLDAPPARGISKGGHVSLVLALKHPHFGVIASDGRVSAIANGNAAP